MGFARMSDHDVRSTLHASSIPGSMVSCFVPTDKKEWYYIYPERSVQQDELYPDLINRYQFFTFYTGGIDSIIP